LDGVHAVLLLAANGAKTNSKKHYERKSMSKENLTALLSSSETRSLVASQNINLKMQIATTAIARTLKQNHFNICDVDRVCKIIGAKPSGAAYDMLMALHCVDYSQMPNEVKSAIPDLLKEVFSQVAFTNDDVVRALQGVRA
jgi:hypothetical protein